MVCCGVVQLPSYGYERVQQDHETADSTTSGVHDVDGRRCHCRAHLSPTAGGRLLVGVGLVLLAVVAVVIFAFLRRRLLSPAVHPSWPLCSPSTPAYLAYVSKHAAIVSLLSGNCSAALLSPPRLLVHDCIPGSCGGLGDRLSKVAGLFLLALLSDRAIFLNHSRPRIQHWWEPLDGGLDWRVHDEVGQCLQRIREQGRTERAAGQPTSVYEGSWSRDFWDDQSWTGWLRAAILPRARGAAVSLVTEPAMWVDAHVNSVRPLEIVGQLGADVRAVANLLPWPVHVDDTMSSMLTGCLLRRLWKASEQSAALIRPLVSQVELEPLSCLLSVHVRWGDELMFHYNRSTVEGRQGEDHRIDPALSVVQASLQCVVRQAHAVCATPTTTATSSVAASLSPRPAVPVALFIFFATDAPRFNHWFTLSVDALAQYDVEHFAAAAFSNITLLSSPWGSPAHTDSFSVISEVERERSEKQLMSDWSMLAVSQAVVTTGSVFSYTAAANGLKYPIDAWQCQPRW